MLFFFFKQKTAYEISACLVGSEMCIRDSNWGCLLFIAAAIAIDAAAIYAIRALALGLMAMAVAACG